LSGFSRSGDENVGVLIMDAILTAVLAKVVVQAREASIADSVQGQIVPTLVTRLQGQCWSLIVRTFRSPTSGSTGRWVECCNGRELEHIRFVGNVFQLPVANVTEGTQLTTTLTVRTAAGGIALLAQEVAIRALVDVPILVLPLADWA